MMKNKSPNMQKNVDLAATGKKENKFKAKQNKKIFNKKQMKNVQQDIKDSKLNRRRISVNVKKEENKTYDVKSSLVVHSKAFHMHADSTEGPPSKKLKSKKKNSQNMMKSEAGNSESTLPIKNSGNLKFNKRKFRSHNDNLVRDEKSENGHTVAKKCKFSSSLGGESDSKKIKLCHLNKKKRKLIRKKNKMQPAVFERTAKLKSIWEELRKENCEPDRQKLLLDQAMHLMKGHVGELVMAHDTARVVECVFGLGNKDQQTKIFDEIKDIIITLAKSHYAKFVVLKILRCGSKDQKNVIINALEGNVIKLIRHKEAATIVEVTFNEFANASVRSRLLQEFYGAEFKYFKESECHSLGQLLEKKPELKHTVIPYIKEALLKVTEKSVIKHSIIHAILNEFMKHADPASRSEVIEAIREVVIEFLHTKDGARAAMQCLWHGTSKDRKAVVKSFRTHVNKIAKEEHGHRVLLALFDCVDDTKLVEKHIISELISLQKESNQHIIDVFQDTYGRKVLLYLLCARNPLHFHPDVINILKEGDNNETSKKGMELRHNELKQCIIAPLVQMVRDNVKELYVNNSFCAGALTILQNTMGQNIDSLKAIAQLAAVEYESGEQHIIEAPGSHYMLKKLISHDDHNESNATFSEVLAEIVPVEVFQAWILCNRGCFLLANLLETKKDSVVKKVEDAMGEIRERISKLSFKGAELLLKKLNH